MKTFITAALAAACLAMPAHALDINSTVNKAKAVSVGGAQSSSGVSGGSLLGGTTGIIAGNAATANGNVTSMNGAGWSSVTQSHNTTSVSGLSSSSSGFAGSVGLASGGAESVGSGRARQRSFGLSVQ